MTFLHAVNFLQTGDKKNITNGKPKVQLATIEDNDNLHTIYHQPNTSLHGWLYLHSLKSKSISDVVVAIFWARVLCHLAVEETRFRMRIILGVVLIRSLACV